MHDIFETPDFQGVSFADSCRFWPIVAKKLGRKWDDERIWGDLQVVRGEIIAAKRSQSMLNAAKRTLIQERLTDKTHAMSSNIRITKCCVYCGQEFTAKTIRTRYCSHVCNQRGYKKAKRDKKLGAAKAIIRVEPLNLKHDPVNWEELTRKPFLTVSEACLVVNVRVETLRRRIKKGSVKTSRIGKKHLISQEFLVNSNNLI